MRRCSSDNGLRHSSYSESIISSSSNWGRIAPTAKKHQAWGAISSRLTSSRHISVQVSYDVSHSDISLPYQLDEIAGRDSLGVSGPVQFHHEGTCHQLMPRMCCPTPSWRSAAALPAVESFLFTTKRNPLRSRTLDISVALHRAQAAAKVPSAC